MSYIQEKKRRIEKIKDLYDHEPTPEQIVELLLPDIKWKQEPETSPNHLTSKGINYATCPKCKEEKKCVIQWRPYVV